MLELWEDDLQQRDAELNKWEAVRDSARDYQMDEGVYEELEEERKELEATIATGWHAWT